MQVMPPIPECMFESDVDEDDGYRFITNGPVHHQHVEQVGEILVTGPLSLQDAIAAAPPF